GLPVAAGRRLVRRGLEETKGDLRGIEFGDVGAGLELAGRGAGNGRVHLPGLEVRRSFEWFRLGRRAAGVAYCVRVAVPGVTKVPGTDVAISLEIVEKTETTELAENVYTSKVGCLD